MQDKKIIAVVGMPGAGKGTCTDYLAETYGWPVAHFGNMVYEEVQRRGLDNVRDEKAVREDMRLKDGPAVLAKHVARKAKDFMEAGAAVVVLDGLYSWSEYKYLIKTFGDALTVIAVVAPKKLRRERVLDRKDGHRKYTLDELIAREIAEVENLEKGGPIAYADYYILNDGLSEQMIAKLESILKSDGITL
jgi:dephospho-CoA kinase